MKIKKIPHVLKKHYFSIFVIIYIWNSLSFRNTIYKYILASLQKCFKILSAEFLSIHFLFIDTIFKYILASLQKMFEKSYQQNLSEFIFYEYLW